MQTQPSEQTILEFELQSPRRVHEINIDLDSDAMFVTEHDVNTGMAMLRQMNNADYLIAGYNIDVLKGYIEEFRTKQVDTIFYMYSRDVKRYIYTRQKGQHSKEKVLSTLCFQCKVCECLDDQLYAMYKMVHNMHQSRTHPEIVTSTYNILLRTRNLLLYHLKVDCRDMIMPSFCKYCQMAYVRVFQK